MLGKPQYIITNPELNHRTNSNDNDTPSQRCTKMAALRIVINTFNYHSCWVEEISAFERVDSNDNEPLRSDATLMTLFTVAHQPEGASAYISLDLPSRPR